MNIDNNLRISWTFQNWYNTNKRDLPWRNTTNPYIIWLSEIILQQTRVDQGHAYFVRFVNQYPTVTDLANADEEDILKLWQGLGYYSRARNLHTAAQTIRDKYNGAFPSQYKDILSLRGVGEYTAAAIASFAFNLPYAVVDGNVYRVLSRIFAINEPINSTKGKKLFSELAQELLDRQNPGQHNQAIMEFGALQCTPASPNCSNCPASSFCLAYANKSVSRHPIKQGKVKIRNRYFNYLDIRQGDLMYLHKRTGKDIWHNLYELPLIETEESMNIEELQHATSFLSMFVNSKVKSIKHAYQLKHVLSHQIIYTNFYQVEVSDDISGDYIKVKTNDADKYPISRLVHKYMESI